MFGWDFKVDAGSIFWRWNLSKLCVRTHDMTSRSYFGKMNSTLGSVVPLAMFTFFPQNPLFWFFRARASEPLKAQRISSSSPVESKGWYPKNKPQRAHLDLGVMPAFVLQVVHGDNPMLFIVQMHHNSDQEQCLTSIVELTTIEIWSTSATLCWTEQHLGTCYSKEPCPSAWWCSHSRAGNCWLRKAWYNIGRPQWVHLGLE